MALPMIPTYDLPDPTDLPANRVDWQVDPARAALLVHDLQNYFVDAFPAQRPPMSTMLDHVARLLDWARGSDVPVAYSAQPGGQTPAERGLQQDFWGPGLPAGSEAGAIVPSVAPQPQDTVIVKWKYSAFAHTDLQEWLERRGRDQLLVVGVYAHIGVLMTAADAWMRDIQAFVVADAVGDFSPEDHAMALDWAAGRCAVVTSTDEVLRSTRASAVAGASA